MVTIIFLRVVRVSILAGETERSGKILRRIFKRKIFHSWTGASHSGRDLTRHLSRKTLFYFKYSVRIRNAEYGLRKKTTIF